MSDPNTTGPANDPQGAAPGSGANWRDMRRAERRARRQARWGMSDDRGVPVGALILIAVGVIVLLGNFGLQIPGHWWSVLLLVPAVGLLVTAIRFYRVDNTFGGRAMGPLIGGLVLLAMALAIFFGLDWGVFWPIVLIAIGAGIIVRRGQPPRP